MIRIAIVDDEKEALNELSNKIIDVLHNKIGVQVTFKISCFQKGKTLLQTMASDNNFDIVFLDIQMPGTDGIQLAQKFRIYNKKIVIVYVSSYGERFIQSMTVHPFSFIKKPYTQQEIAKVMQDYMDYYNLSGSEDNSFFEFDDGEKYIKVEETEIVFFKYVANRTIQLVTLSKGTFELTASVSSIYENLNKQVFLMPNSGCVVNAYNIKKVDGETMSLIMKNDACIPISRRKYKDIIISIGFLMNKKG